MRHFITPLQDASLYQGEPTRNTGYDEILEVGKLDGDAVRALVQFDLTALSASIVAGRIPLGASHSLNLRLANATSFKRNQTIEFWTVSESWEEGTGNFSQDLVNPRDGVTWNDRQASVTWSLSGSGATTGSLITSFSFDWMPSDVRLDITAQVQAWISGSPNYGLLIKLPSADEADASVKTNVKFFSRNTHTVFPPTLEVVWHDQVFSTAGNCGLSLAPDDFELTFPDTRRSYVSGSTVRVRIYGRTLQPTRTFSDRARFSNDYLLPSGSMFSIVDNATQVVIVPFDSGSMVSADATSSYFMMKVENQYPGRTYGIKLSIPKSWGDEVVDTGILYKVVR